MSKFYLLKQIGFFVVLVSRVLIFTNRLKDYFKLLIVNDITLSELSVVAMELMITNMNRLARK